MEGLVLAVTVTNAIKSMNVISVVADAIALFVINREKPRALSG